VLTDTGFPGLRRQQFGILQQLAGPLQYSLLSTSGSAKYCIAFRLCVRFRSFSNSEPWTEALAALLAV